MADFILRCEGTTALITHNELLANPLADVTRAIKRISGKRNKTDDDYEEMARLEHSGGLYIDPDVGPYIPSHNLFKCLIEAARTSSDGKKIERGVLFDGDINPLSYDGPRTADELWEDERFRFQATAVVQRRRVMRTRPKFPTPWVVEAPGKYDPSLINLRNLQEIAERAGKLVGLCEWRPRYGRFDGTIKTG